MKISIFARVVCLGAASLSYLTTASAQNVIPVFSPVNVRLSANGTGNGAAAVTFNSSTLNLSCPVNSPIAATLSSTGGGNVLVDNNMQVTVTSSQGTSSVPTNVCVGGVVEPASDNQAPSPDCFTRGYQAPASAGKLTGQDPDTFVATGGVAPIKINSLLQPGNIQVKIDLIDTGGYLANSTIVLNTNCSQSGVSGPAVLSGNPIPQNNPTPQELTQHFNFNSSPNQNLGFVYDLSQAQDANSLTTQQGTIPQVTDMPVTQSVFQTTLVPNTSFSTSSCLLHSGEVVNDVAACKLFTLQCSVGTGNTLSGANCPVSSLPNEVFEDIFDGPAFTLPDITTPSNGVFHQGIGFLMANEGWTGGPCIFDPNANLQSVPCPQNLLSSFSGPGIYSMIGGTSHPNSTFIAIAQVPEDRTTVTTAGVTQYGWVNTSTPSVTFSSQPPVLTGTTLPGASTFFASPIQEIVYGVSPTTTVPLPANPATTDVTLTNPVACPLPTNPHNPLATVFTTTPQTLSSLADGIYAIHYYAQDCAGTRELKFFQDQSSSWNTVYYTALLQIDTVPPVVTSGPTLTPLANGQTAYALNQPVTATYSCSDERSGLVQCGATQYPGTPPTLTTGVLTSSVDTSVPGPHTYTVTAVDAAGNQSSVSVPYTVASSLATIQVSLSSSTVTYPQGTNAVIQVAPTMGHVPTGIVKLYDGMTLVQTANLQGNGAAYLYFQGLAVGNHSLSVSYSGDAYNAGGTSAPVPFTVTPVQVTLSASCYNSNFAYGPNEQCGIYLGSAAGAPTGYIVYSADGGSPVNVPLQNGVAKFTLVQPQAGAHSIVVSYPAQTNYAQASPATVHYTVTPAKVTIQLSPSSWYVTGGPVTLTATLQTSNVAPPVDGQIVFSASGKPFATVTPSASGTVSATLPAGSLSLMNGSTTFTASYLGSPDYAAASTSVAITVALP